MASAVGGASIRGIDLCECVDTGGEGAVASMEGQLGDVDPTGDTVDTGCPHDSFRFCLFPPR